MSRPPPFRAEHIGSLLRPAELLHARQQHAAGKLDRNALTAIENEAIARVVKLQEDLGLQVVTDGEFRRGTYSDPFTSAGISGVRIEMTEDHGWTKSQSHGHRMARRGPTSAAMSIPISTLSGPIWSRPTSAKCVHWRRLVADTYRLTKRRWSSSAIRACGNCWRSAARIGATSCTPISASSMPSLRAHRRR